MKRIVFILLASATLLFAQVKFASFSGVVALTTVPQQLTNVNFFVTTFTILGKTANGRTTNTSAIYLGTTSADDTQTYAINPGGEAVIVAKPGQYLNLIDWYVDVTTANDGFTIIYQ